MQISLITNASIVPIHFFKNLSYVRRTALGASKNCWNGNNNKNTLFSMQRELFLRLLFNANLRCHRASSFLPFSSECPKLRFQRSFCMFFITFHLFSLFSTILIQLNRETSSDWFIFVSRADKNGYSTKWSNEEKKNSSKLKRIQQTDSTLCVIQAVLNVGSDAHSCECEVRVSTKSCQLSFLNSESVCIFRMAKVQISFRLQ